MNELAAALEATALAQFLKGSHWIYPLVNAGHLLGVALLVGAIVPMDLAQVNGWRRVDPAVAAALLRPFAIWGFLLATGFGALLFITQAGDYMRNPVFVTKIGLIGVAGLNAALHSRLARANVAAGRRLALLSLLIWPLVLLLGRLVGYVIG